VNFLLDSNAIIAILNSKPPSVRNKWLAVSRAGAHVATSSIVVFELLYGAYKSSRPRENVARLHTLLSSSLEVSPFELEDADSAGQVRAALEAKGQPIGPFDVLIAGQALRRGLTLVTANVGEFRRLPGLTLENWQKT
jgi:tRNA(fMet)-specific endonuclease VapC